MRAGIGIALRAHPAFLDACAGAVTAADHVQIKVEQLWAAGPRGEVCRAAHHAELVDRLAPLCVVATGEGVSLGTAHRDDADRRDRWIERIAAEHALFDFEWYGEPLGATWLAGRSLAMPVPLPMTERAARVVRGRLRALQRAVPTVAVINSGGPFLFGAVEDEPRFLRRILKPRAMHLSLDLGRLLALTRGDASVARRYLGALDHRRIVNVTIDVHPEGPDQAQVALRAEINPSARFSVTLRSSAAVDAVAGASLIGALGRLRAVRPANAVT